MRTATISRAAPRRPRNYGKGQQLLPPMVRRFLQQRLVDGGALCLVALALALAVAFASYDHSDPSRNTATGRLASNLLGSVGSYTSDFLLSGFGFVAGLLPVTLASWGAFILIRRPLRHWPLRIIALLVCLISGSLLLSFVPFTLFNSAGGSLGSALHALLMQSLGPLLGIAAIPAIILAAAVLFVPLLVSMLGFTLTEYGRMASASVNASKATALRAQDLAQTWSRRPSTDESDREIPVAAPVTPELFPADTSHRAERKKAVPAKRSSADAPRSPEPDFLTGGDYSLPPLHLMQLAPAAKIGPELSREALNANSAALAGVLQDFGVKGDIVRINPGPVVTLYELEPAPGTKSSRVIGLADDIARSLSAVSVRVAVVPGRNAIGIELPNQRRETVFMRDVLESEVYQQATARLPLMLGKEIGGQPIVADLARMPHLLVAGTTGSGKSVAINTMILSLLYRLSPDQCKFIMVDPKMLELSVYDGIPHLLTPVVTEPKKAVVALKWTVRETEDRYRNMSKLGVRNIDGYNARLKEARETGEVLTRKVQTGFDPDTGKPVFEDQNIDLQELPYIVVIVDEFADLMLVAGKDIEAAIQRLAQMARAAGIHLIMATQRPSVDVITGTIKANFPTRISFAVSSRIDSRTILNESGAEQLLGQGDMLYMASGGRITRVHGPFVRDDEVEHIVAFLKKQGEPQYIDAVTEDDGSFGSDGEDGGAFDGDSGSGDELYDKAVALVARERKASTSFVQRHFQVGYNKAARLIERMEKEGVVSTANHVGKREVLVRSTRDED